MANYDEDDIWYVGGSNNSSQEGPFELDQLVTKWANKDINSNTLGWTAGQIHGWLPIGQIPHLHKKLVAGAEILEKENAPVENSETKGKGESSLKKKFNHIMRQPSVGGWKEQKTLDGMAYYYNWDTEEISWDKPDELKLPSERRKSRQDLIWVPHKDTWAPSQRVKTNKDGSFSVQTIYGYSERLTFEAGTKTFPIEKESSLVMLEDDLVMLDQLHEASIIHNLRSRYKNDDIYTWVGASNTVLISVNPFKQLNLYSPDVIESYREKTPNKVQKPHVFAVANSAYEAMCLDGKNQSILISGESGAGKTEATKQCLNFLADAAGSEDGVEEQILVANPLLEAFGNAKTIRNNNSSRFGKWIEIKFNLRQRVICGAKIVNYLLEKSRVVSQQPKERNYHIFYQLCNSEETCAKYDLGMATEFNYTNKSGCTTVRGISDSRAFDDTIDAMEKLEFTKEEMDWVLCLTSGVLHLGNVEFEEDYKDNNHCSMISKNRTPLVKAAKFLDLDVKQLEKVLCSRSILVRGERSEIPLEKDAAIAGRDSLAKAVYASLFDWLVKRINHTIQRKSKWGTNITSIGVLDIFGFEIFEKNSFEQLCINFANEKLQQHFNKHTFKEETHLYQSEEISFEQVNFIDNQQVLDLIEKKPMGVFLMLDEELKLPGGTDLKFSKRIKEKHKESSAIHITKDKFESPLSFFIVHYAGMVKYNASGFLDKNRDILSSDMYNVCANANKSLTRSLFPKLVDGKGNVSKVPTLSFQFRKNLASLMDTLNSTNSRYIRCIKPNHGKRPNEMIAKMVVEQLRYSGVFEAVEIRKSGFPFRLRHDEFASRYSCINHFTLSCPGWHDYEINLKTDPKGRCEEILSTSKQNFHEIEMGKTMVLYRTKEHRVLELLRNLALEKLIPICQKAFRGFLAREFRRRIVRAENLVQSAMNKGTDISALDEALASVSGIIGSLREMFPFTPRNIEKAKDLKKRLHDWLDIEEELEEHLRHEDINLVHDKISSCLKEAEKLMATTPTTEKQKALYERAKDELVNCKTAKIDPEAEEALYVLDRERMEKVVNLAAELIYESDIVSKVKELLALNEEEFTKLQLKKAIALKDPLRRIHREIRLKEIYLDSYGSHFDIRKTPNLKDPMDYANAKKYIFSSKVKELAENMLKFSTKPIHTSLMEFNEDEDFKFLVKQAKTNFKNVLGYMGDRPYENQNWLATNVLNLGLQEPRLRTEIMMQIVKQLTDNPSPKSMQSGWELMGMCLHTFPPCEVFENYLSVWLRDNAPNRGKVWFSAMHTSQYGELRKKSPNISEVAALKQRFNTMKKSRFSVAFDSGPLVKVESETVTA